MKKSEVHIPEPCPADWNEMHGDERRRFCDHCTKHVHDLSAMNRADAEAFLAENQDNNICVQYLHDEEQNLVFRDDEDQSWKMFWQRDGLQRLVAAAALVLPMSLAAGCDQKQTTVTAQPHAPIQIQDGSARIQTSPPSTTPPAETVPGSGRAPTFPTTNKKPTETPTPRTVELETGEVAPSKVEIEKGKVAAHQPERAEPDTKTKEGDGSSCDDGKKKAETDATPTTTPEPKRIKRTLGKRRPRHIRKTAGKPMLRDIDRL